MVESKRTSLKSTLDGLKGSTVEAHLLAVINYLIKLEEPRFDIKLLYENSKAPIRAKEGDSGLDVFSHSFKELYTAEGVVVTNFEGATEVIVGPHERLILGVGFAVAVDIGWEIQVRPRSGSSRKQGFTVINTPGTVDSGYRNEVGVILLNTSGISQKVQLEERIAQIVHCKVEQKEPTIVTSLEDTDRGLGGFGHTGKS